VTARVLGRVLAVVVLVASGAYFLVYLYRWEWIRALVAGVFFLAAAIAVVASVVLRRLSAIEERLDELKERPAPAPAPPPAALEAIAASAPPPKDRFAWLGSSRTNVFLPILLGAGVLLSGVATVVERIAGATARPVLEHRLALRLQPLALPAGGPLGPAVPMVVAPRRRGAMVGRVFALAVAALLLYGAVDALSDATQTRGDTDMSGTTTAFVLEITHRNSGSDTVEATNRLWEACRSTFERTMNLEGEEPVALGGNRVGLEVTPGLGKGAYREFRGCLQDLRVDRVQADVVSSTTGPSGR
jgi:hypothetical protein